jgi:tetratricopeptide (TPR) repeat protein
MAENCERWKSPRCNADEFFQRAIARGPDIAGTYVVYGIYLLRVGRPNDGIENLKRAIEIDPDSMNAHYNIALAYLDAKQYQLANEHAQKAYALGAQLPGLRDRLKRAGHWQPAAPATAAEPSPAVKSSQPDAAAPSAGAEPKAN